MLHKGTQSHLLNPISYYKLKTPKNYWHKAEKAVNLHNLRSKNAKKVQFS